MNTPIIRFEVEGIKHTIIRALSEHQLMLDEQMRAAVEGFCNQDNIGRVIEEIAREQLKRAVEDEVKSFFDYSGPGRVAVRNAVREMLIAQMELPE